VRARVETRGNACDAVHLHRCRQHVSGRIHARLLLATAQRLSTTPKERSPIATPTRSLSSPPSTRASCVAPIAPTFCPMARAVLALSRTQVNDILDDLAAFKVYDLDGSSFKIEDVNRDEEGDRREVIFLGSREKSYCLVAGSPRSPTGHPADRARLQATLPTAPNPQEA
jgi:hypothetical protein